MQVAVTSDKFAGTLSAAEACAAIAIGWHESAPQDEIVQQPMSDGGPGFLSVLAAAMRERGQDFEVLRPTCEGPHGEPTEAEVVMVDWVPLTAYIEVAQCCGLDLAPNPKRPLEASSRGVARLISAALEAGARKVVVGVGGTASTDGGRPVVSALADQIEPDVEFVVATDVDSPLLGPAGAARSFGTQKGASDREVGELERRLSAWAWEAGGDPNQRGAGAGGGLGYGLMLLGAAQVSGAALVADMVGLSATVRGADLVVTGEGRLDFSSRRSKVISQVAEVAQQNARPCLAIVGDSQLGRRETAVMGLDEVISLTELVGAEAALQTPAEAMREAASRAASSWTRVKTDLDPR